MKKFLIKLSIFIVLLTVTDIALVGVFKLFDYTRSGEIHKIHSIMTKETPQLLVLGSSRASHHYNPQILKDILDLSVYNAGLDGVGTTIANGFLKGLGREIYPEIILCELTPKFDLYQGGSVGLNNLYPYSNFAPIKDIIISFDSSEKFKLISNGYKLNSVLLRVLPSIFSKSDDATKGFTPLYGSIKDSSPIILDLGYKKDPVKEMWLRNLIDDALLHSCLLIFTISPAFNNNYTSLYSDEIAIIQEYNLPLLNHLNDPRFQKEKRFFQDLTHMNIDGATLYSRIIANEVDSIISQNSINGSKRK